MAQIQNNWPFIINVGNSIIGVTILAMPFCFQQCGMVLGSLMLFFSTWLTIKSCQLLVKAGVASRRKSFSLLAYFTHGATGKLFVELCMIGMQLGTLVAQVVIIGDLGPAIVSKATGFENSSNLRTSLIVCLCLFVGLPLGLLKDLRTLSKASTMCILFYTFFTCYVVLQSVPNLYRGEWFTKIRFWRIEGFFQCLPIFSFAFGCQTQLFIVYNALAEPSVKRINGIISSAVWLCMAAYLLVAFFGYIAFSNEKELTGDIINHFHENGLSDAIKLCFVISIAVSIPLIVFPCRTSLYTLLFPQERDQEENISSVKPKDDVPGSAKIPEQHFQVITAAIIIGAMVTGILVPNVEFVLGLTGATMGTLICYIFPALFFIHVMSEASEGRFTSKIVLISGLTILIASTYITLNPQEKVPEVVPLDKGLVDAPVDNGKAIDRQDNVDEVKRDINKPDLEVKNKPPDDIGVDTKRHEPPVPEAPDDREEEKKDKEKEEQPVNKDKEKTKEKEEVKDEQVVKNDQNKGVMDEKDKLAADTKDGENKEKIDSIADNEKLKLGEKIEENKEKEAEDKIKKQKEQEEKEKKEEEERRRIETEKQQQNVLKKLEQQQEEQEKLIQEQKEILEELKQHKDEHKESVKEQNDVVPIQDVAQQQQQQLQGQLQNQALLQPVGQLPGVGQVPVQNQQVQMQPNLQPQVVDQNQLFNQPGNLQPQVQNQPVMQNVQGMVQQPVLNQPGIVQNVGPNLVQNMGQNLGQNPGQNVVQNPGQNVVQNLGQNIVQNPGQMNVQNPGQNVVQNPNQNLGLNMVQNQGQNLAQNIPAGQGLINQAGNQMQFQNVQGQQQQQIGQQFVQQPVLNQQGDGQQLQNHIDQQKLDIQKDAGQHLVLNQAVGGQQVQAQQPLLNAPNNILEGQQKQIVENEQGYNQPKNGQNDDKLILNNNLDIMKHRGKRDINENAALEENVLGDDAGPMKENKVGETILEEVHHMEVKEDKDTKQEMNDQDNVVKESVKSKLEGIEKTKDKNIDEKETRLDKDNAVNEHDGNEELIPKKDIQGEPENNGQRDLKMVLSEKIGDNGDVPPEEVDYIDEVLKNMRNKFVYEESQRFHGLDIQDNGKLHRR